MEEAAANLTKRNVLRKQWLEKLRMTPAAFPKSPVRTHKTPTPLSSTTSNITGPPAVTETESEPKGITTESIPPPHQPPVAETTTV